MANIDRILTLLYLHSAKVYICIDLCVCVCVCVCVCAHTPACETLTLPQLEDACRHLVGASGSWQLHTGASVCVLLATFGHKPEPVLSSLPPLTLYLSFLLLP